MREEGLKRLKTKKMFAGVQWAKLNNPPADEFPRPSSATHAVLTVFEAGESVFQTLLLNETVADAPSDPHALVV